MTLWIDRPGPLTTVQDLGRTGYLAEGICPSGAMDIPAARAANALVGNAPGAAVLEMTLQGITARFEADACIALAGADMPATLDGVPMPRYQAVLARAGAVLACGFAASGCRAYLAVSGGIAVPPVLGSRSTHVRASLGGHEGRALRAGDLLPVGPCRGALPIGKGMQPPPAPPDPLTIRVTDGPQRGLFTRAEMQALLAAEFRVSPQSDRMGIRLDSPPLRFAAPVDIISDCVPPGAVQLPASGQPIILLADRQTTGGYAKPCVVIAADLPLLAQARPGTRLRLAHIPPWQARWLYRYRKEMR